MEFIGCILKGPAGEIPQKTKLRMISTRRKSGGTLAEALPETPEVSSETVVVRFMKVLLKNCLIERNFLRNFQMSS